MAKDLPYFKFVISEWNDGDITLCSMEAQGLFINLCSIYWSQEGDLSITRAKRRYKDCNTTVWDELIGERIIKIDGDQIVINFLDEQFRDRAKLSKTNADNVRKRWEKGHYDTVVLQSNNDGNGLVYNIEEKREEEKRREKKRVPLRAFEIPFIGLVLSSWHEWEKYRTEKKQKLTPSTALKQIQFLGGRGDPEIIAIINQSITAGWTGLFELKIKENGIRTGTKTSTRTTDAIIEPNKAFGTKQGF